MLVKGAPDNNVAALHVACEGQDGADQSCIDLIEPPTLSGSMGQDITTQNWRHFLDDIFEWIFLNENLWLLIKISLKFVPRV